ncbi:transposable element Tcb2 transposase [Trichonephila clavipes]|nr:transposable element Tcb2 transposase [Trichonephila clavipes]
MEVSGSAFIPPIPLGRKDGERATTSATRGFLARDHVILNHVQVTWTTPELAPPSPNYHTTSHQREDVSALDRFNVHRCPTRRVFSGTGFEPVTKQATVRYLYHSATAATSVRRHLDAFTRGRIIGKNSYPGVHSGHPRGTTPADDRYIVLQARRNRRQTAGEIDRHTTQATGRPISRFTVARRLHGGGLFARRPVRCVPLRPAHRRRRSLWCREHRKWRDNEWGRVLFTDESRFSLSSDFHRILIWRERGSRNHPSNIIERDRYGGRGVLVWGGIMLGSRTELHIFDAGSVNGTRYCNEILLPICASFRGAMGLQFLFMDDNAPCHRTVASEQLLESEDIERMDWPARSPDLNPIEHVWDFLGRRLAARTLPPVTIRELRLALQDEWAAMPQQLIDTLILSMGRRCETCLAVRGDHIPY